ncbi:tissue factor pathway inhibitor isoform X10 [Desmodus rotundus]|uniref:tissue factor pathway inhibitor isoform X10 n=1 Tax=Desmodus rotundus TaxID=9430 RepID=UPI00238141BA|nr:tissue factor pathway inhibitor-like isoform X7 [Desmodus rotundus]
MKIKPIWGVSVCLLLTCASLPLNAEKRKCSKTPVSGTCTQSVSDYNVPPTPSPPTPTTTLEKPDFCFLEEEVGNCRAYFIRYFYNNQSKKCERFVYGGCPGNRNNFLSLEECKNTCENPLRGTSTQPVPVPETAKPPKHKIKIVYRVPYWCRTPADRGLCNANVTRFYYNLHARKCLQFSYSGCGGNENNFNSRKSCLRACRRGFIKKGLNGKLIKDKPKKYLVEVKYDEI